jgi:hypothetical protein
MQFNQAYVRKMSLVVSRILHAGYFFQCNQTSILMDPIFENPFSRNCHAFPPVKFDLEQIRSLRPSAVFISHHHDDHCSLESLNLLDRATPIYLFCLHDEMFEMIRALGFQHVHPLKLDEQISIGEMTVTAKRALDAEVDSIFHIQVQGLNILNVVDSWIDEDQMHEFQKTKWDLVLWPFQTMREVEVLSPSRAEPSDRKLPTEWLSQLQSLNPRCLIPSSCQFQMEDWSWYNQAFFPISYKGFESQTSELLPQTQIGRLDPSQSLTWDEGTFKFSQPLPWVQLLTTEILDYQYQTNSHPQTTSQIAQRFPKLTTTQTKRVLHYCQSEILERYQSINEFEDPYFQKPRHWQLSLFDQDGLKTAFSYIIKNGRLNFTESTAPVSWTTEVPIFKLHEALENGEALTSLYIRINDQVFSDEIEKALLLVEPLEDPLIRCLYTGIFGAYQRAQLGRIRSP